MNDKLPLEICSTSGRILWIEDAEICWLIAVYSPPYQNSADYGYSVTASVRRMACNGPIGTLESLAQLS